MRVRIPFESTRTSKKVSPGRFLEFSLSGTFEAIGRPLPVPVSATGNLAATWISRVLFQGVLISLLFGALKGADRTWDGGGGNDNWTNQRNWNGDTDISSNDALFFAGSTRLTPLNNIANGADYNSITFNAAAGSFTLSGNRIDLNPNGAVTNQSANAQIVNLPIRLLANGTFTSNGGLLTIGGTMIFPSF